MRHASVSTITKAAVIAALYAALTVFSNTLGIGSGPVQVRLSEALTVLPLFTPAALWGLPLGCMLSALFTPMGAGMLADLLVGSLATFLGAVGTRLLKKYRVLPLLPPVLFNALMIPFVLSFAYGAEEAIPLMMLTVGLGEAIAVFGLGSLLRVLIERNRGALRLDEKGDGFWN